MFIHPVIIHVYIDISIRTDIGVHVCICMIHFGLLQHHIIHVNY